MGIVDRRHARQARLVGIGQEGQDRLSAAVVAVDRNVDEDVGTYVDGRREFVRGSDGERALAAEVCVRYLAGAGVAALVVDDTRLEDAARAVDGRVTVWRDDGGGRAERAHDGGHDGGHHGGHDGVQATVTARAPHELSCRLAFHDATARAVGEGALAALVALRAIVSGPPESPSAAAPRRPTSPSQGGAS